MSERSGSDGVFIALPPLVSGRCAGSAGLQKAFFPSNVSGTDGQTSVRVCLRLRFPRGTAVVAASM